VPLVPTWDVRASNLSRGKDYPKTVRGFAVPVLSHAVHPPFSPTIHTNMNHSVTIVKSWWSFLNPLKTTDSRVRVTLRLAVYRQSVRLGAKPVVRNSQETYYIADGKNNRLMLFRKTVAVHWDNRTKHINKLCRQNAEFKFVKAGGIRTEPMCFKELIQYTSAPFVCLYFIIHSHPIIPCYVECPGDRVSLSNQIISQFFQSMESIQSVLWNCIQNLECLQRDRH
jgi:hypothetical protein